MYPSDRARALAEEVKLYEPILRGYLQRRFPSLPDHDDILQEAYSRVLRADGYDHTCAKAFLFTVARNVAIDLLRRQRVAHEPISDLTHLPLLDEAPGIVESIERQQRREVLIEAVASLPERCREVLMLRYLDGLAYKEIAVRLGISPETVKVHLVKGVRDCTAFFRKNGQLETIPVSSSRPADSETHLAK